MRARRHAARGAAARAAAACAIGALAAVFSVQQGEHGPLVVYKLQVRPQAAPTAPPAPPGEPVVIIPSRAPRVLGTVVLPAGRPAAPLPVPLAPALVEAATPAPVAGDGVTLQQVSDELTWRRETAGKLPPVPFAPRF